MDSRKKGHAYEHKIAELIRGWGFDCVTSRSESKNLDDKGVDFVTDFPFNIQAKATERTPPYHELLKAMPHDKPPLVFHKRNNKGTVVVMELDTFEHIQRVFMLAASLHTEDQKKIEAAIKAL